MKESDPTIEYISKSVTFPAEVNEDYSAYIIRADRFVLDESYDLETPAGPITGFTHASLTDGESSANINVPASASDKTGRATFVYTKNDWSDYGDETSLTNAIKKSKAYVALTASWVGDPTKVDANLLYDPASQLSVYAVYDDGSVKKLKTSEYVVDGSFVTDSGGDKRWPGTAGSYQYTVSATIGGTTRSSMFQINVLPPEKVLLYFHTNAAGATNVHIPVAYTSTSVENNANVDVVEVYKHQKLSQALGTTNLDLTWSGHQFIAWSKTDGSGEEINMSDEILEETHYYALWGTDFYKVIYHDNMSDSSVSISGMPSNSVFSYGSNAVITSSIPSASKGYEFVSWNTAEDGSGTTYASGTSNYTGNSTLNLYAIWEKHSAVIKYKSNEISGDANDPVAGFKDELPAQSMPSQTTLYYGSTTTAATGPTKTGYVFEGWNTKSDGSGTSYNSGDRLIAEGRDFTQSEMENGISLYAQWTKLSLGDNGENTDNGNLSWDMVETIGDSGVASEFFADDFMAVKNEISNDGIVSASILAEHTKEITVSGSTVHAMIAGFDHDETSDGGTAAITFITYESVAQGTMERSGSTATGWSESNARTITMNTLKSSLETSLSTRLETVKKKSVNSSGNVTTTEDQLFLPSVEELTGTYSFDNVSEAQ